MNNIKPKAIFSGHDHKVGFYKISKNICHNWKSGILHWEFCFQAKYRMYKTGMFSTEEYVLPTCSYRMGSIHMGIGVAILGIYFLLSMVAVLTT